MASKQADRPSRKITPYQGAGHQRWGKENASSALSPRVVSEAQFKIGAAPKKAKNRSKIGVFLLKGLILSQKSVFTLKNFLCLMDLV